jgi:hypothetical protein
VSHAMGPPCLQLCDFTVLCAACVCDRTRVAFPGQVYIQQMTDRHAKALLEVQEQLHAELTKKPPKFSKELLDWRSREHLLAKCAWQWGWGGCL